MMSNLAFFLLAIQFFNIFADGLLGPFYAVFVKNIAGDFLTAGSAYALNLLVIGVLIVISGRIAQKHHTEKIQLIIGYSINLIVAIGYLLIQTQLQLFAIQILSGIAIATFQPAFSGLFSSQLSHNHSHTAKWGDYFGLTYIASALAALSAGIITQQFGFNALFVLMIITQSIALIGAIYITVAKKV